MEFVGAALAFGLVLLSLLLLPRGYYPSGVARRINKPFYRAGWPPTGHGVLPRAKRVGWCWWWVGPYVIGTVSRWDREAA